MLRNKQRRVIAPPGKLGVRFTLRGSCVCVSTLAKESPLRGEVAVGWVLRSIDGVPVAGHHDAARKLVDKQGEARSITFATDDACPPWSKYGAAAVAAVDAFVAVATAKWSWIVAPHMPLPVVAVCLCLPLLLLLHQWRAICSGPGYAAELEPPDGAALAESRTCVKCGWHKPSGCHHCSDCGRCVLGMDHHCYWLGGCVGKKNYASFLMLEGYAFAACLAQGGTALAAILLAPLSGWQVFLLAHFAPLLALAGGLVLRCLCLHIKLVDEGKSTLSLLYGETDSRQTDVPPQPATAAAAAAAAAPAASTVAAPAAEPAAAAPAGGGYGARARVEDIFGVGGARYGMPAAWMALVTLHRTSPRFRRLVDRVRVY